jgi:Retroviral aspartyl protease/Retrotransposon gag protein
MIKWYLFPSFSGDDPEECISQCEYLFELHEVPECNKTVQAVATFRGEAGSWYRGYRATKGHPPWPGLIELLKVRFSKTEGVSAYDEMKGLSQVESVRDYMRQFEVIKAKSQIEFPYLPESHYVTAFISGLREDIKHLVISQHYQGLLDVFQYAKHMEVALDFHSRRNKPVFKSGSVNSFTPPRVPVSRERVEEGKLLTNKENNKNALIEHRRALGLCFKCGEKYYPGHQCRIKVHMMVEQEEGQDLGNEEAEQTENEECKVEEAVISIFAISGNPHLSTMRFKGKIGLRDMCALLDSDSTDSFVSPNVLQGFKYAIVETEPIVVMLADGTIVVTDSKCERLRYSLQGHEFCDDVRILNIQGYDMILGIDWLRQHRPMHDNGFLFNTGVKLSS